MLQDKVSLLITVDCGVTAGKEVQAMNKQGIDVIVTDHHMPTEIGRASCRERV